MQRGKLQSRNAIIAAGSIGSSVEVTQPLHAYKLAKKSGETPLRPNVPRSNNEQKDRQVRPMQKQAEAQTSLSIQQPQDQQHCPRIKQTVHSFGQTSERRANPKAKKPKTAKAAPLITAYVAKDRTGNESAENRLRHNEPSEQKSAAGAKINQTGEETAPVISQPFAD